MIQHNTFHYLFFISAALTIVFFTGIAKGVEVRVNEVEFNLLETPEFASSGETHSEARRAEEKEWLQIFLELETSGEEEEWLDELSITWHVLLEGGMTPRLYFTASTSYIDIKGGSNHYATVYLRPEIVERYYSDQGVKKRNVLVYLEVTKDGVPVDGVTYNPGNIRVPENWWRSGSVNRVANALLSPQKTPFQWLDNDFYMTPKGIIE